MNMLKEKYRNWVTMTSKTRFDLEEDIMSCWQVTDDINLLCEAIGEDPVFKDMNPEHCDKLMNLLLGMREINNLKFNKLFNTFTEVCFNPRDIRNTTDKEIFTKTSSE